MTNLESDGTHISQDLAVLVHKQEDAADWSFRVSLTSLAFKVQIIARGRVLSFTLVVNNDTKNRHSCFQSHSLDQV